MRILVDTNVFLDVLMDRPEWSEESTAVLDWSEAHPSAAWIAWHTLSNLYYIGAKTAGSKKAMRQIDAILASFEIAPTSTQSALAARNFGMKDYEDALQAAAALECKADVIVTRNVPDFKKSPVKAMTPVAFMKTVS